MSTGDYKNANTRSSGHRRSKVSSRSSLSPKINTKSSVDYRSVPVSGKSFKKNATLEKARESDIGSKRALQTNCVAPCRSGHVDRVVSTSQLLSAAAAIWRLVGQHETLETREGWKYSVSSCEDNTKCCPVDNVLCRPASDFGKIRNNNGGCYSEAESIYKDLFVLKMQLLCSSSFNNVSSLSISKQVKDIFKLSHAHIFQASKDKWVKSYTESLSVSSSSVYNCHDSKDGKECEKSCTVLSVHTNNQTPVNIQESISENVNENLNGKPYHADVYSNTICQLQPVVRTQVSSTSLVEKYSPVTKCSGASQDKSLTTNSVVGELVSNTYAEDDNCSTKQYLLNHQHRELEGSLLKSQLSRDDWFCNTISMNRHALSGAISGTVVSLCLHPVDTVKTIIQANRTEKSSFFNLLKHTIDKRGLLGLYSGITTKVASSAPISAIYTYTYESVKGALLPVFPKEYSSLVHCIAGGCSSIATSVVFIPSECIKQHMQLGSMYRNCWSALVGCIEKGGLASLYFGWSAVLWRNIPHSIIKFYTYETLKQFSMAQGAFNTPNSSCQTLVCGGIAGSTAALFTTPFDVVKTRVQTQQLCGGYRGVFHALLDISKQEGLHGLFRGLMPRLAMYISQGAIFFASYECFKSIFSFGAEQPTKTVEDEKNS